MAAHDPSYKLLFSHREMVADLVRGFVREDWVAALDFDTLERVRESGISHDLREREDDILWRLRWGERWLYVYLLLEFQSTVDRLMAVRLLTYVGLLYQDLAAAGEIPPGGPLPPVLPIVLYNGQAPWTARTSLADLMEPDLPEQLRPGSPRSSICSSKSAATPRPICADCAISPPPSSGWRTVAPRRISKGWWPAWWTGSPRQRKRPCGEPSWCG